MNCIFRTVDNLEKVQITGETLLDFLENPKVRVSLVNWLGMSSMAWNSIMQVLIDLEKPLRLKFIPKSGCD